MVMTERALNRSTLARQLLLEREPIDAVEAVRRVVAVQAQQPGSPYIALWNRVAGFDPARLDAGVAEFRVVRTTLMRLTLHLVHVEDYRVFREALEPTLRGSRLGDPRFRAAGLTAADADALLPGLLAYAREVRSGAELRARMEEGAGAGPLEAVAWRLLRQYAPLWHAPTGPPWSFGRAQAFVAAAELPDLADPGAAEAGLAVLIRRYVAGFGPASVADMSQFGMVGRSRVRAALRVLAEEGGRIEEVAGPGGTVLYDVPGAPRPDEDVPAPPRLMAMWDSVLLAYADRGRLIPPAYRKHVIRVNGDVLPTLLVDGYVAGVWRPVDGGVEAAAFRPLPAGVWEGLAEEAAALGALLRERDPGVYRRYDHWWAKGLPTVETRVLPAGA